MIKIKDPIYLRHIYFYDNSKSMERALKRKGIDISEYLIDIESKEGITVDADNIYMYIRDVHDINESPDLLATLHHECVHAAMSILNRVGVNYTDNQEALAYYSGFVFSSILEKIWK